MSNKILFPTFLSLAFICCLAIINPIEAQNISINANGGAPDNSAMLDVSSTTMGLLAPRMSLVQRNAIVNPATGLLIYQTDVDSGFYYNIGIPATPNWLKMQSQDDGMTFISDQDGDTYVETEENTDDDTLRFFTAGTQNMTITPSGEIGIGTITPGFKLEVSDIASNSITAEIKNENSGATIASTGTVGLRISVTDNAAVDRTGLEVYVDGTGASANNAINGIAYSSSAGVNKGLYGVAQNSSTFNYGVHAVSNGNIGTNYGVYSSVSGAGAGNKFGFYANMGGSGTKYGAYIIGEDINYFSGSVGIGTNAPDSLFDVAGGAEIDRLSIAGIYTFPNTAPTINGDVLQYNGADLIWAPSSNTLSSVLAAGNDANADTIVNLNALNIGSPGMPSASLIVDSSMVVQGKPFGGFKWFGHNVSYDGVSAGPQYLNNDYADMVGFGLGRLQLAHFGSNTAGNLLTAANTTIDLEDSTIKLQGVATNFQIQLGGTVLADSIRIGNSYSFPASSGTLNQVLQYNGSGDLIWATNASQTLSGVLTAGNDAGADSISNLNALTIGSTRASLTSLEVDSFFVVMGKPFNGFRWSGYNAYYDGVSADPQYLNDGTADLFVSGPDKLILAHWNMGTANSILPNNAATSIEMDSTSISLLGEDVNFEIYLEGNVGIGTATPSTKLTVLQNSATPIMNLQSAGSNTLMDFNNTGVNPADWTFGYLGNTGVNPGFMTFLRGGVHRMTITNNGDVGIGTTTPSYLLDVNGSARVNNLRVNTANLQFGASMEVANRMNVIGTGSPSLFIGNNGSNYVQLIYNSAGYGQLFTTGANDLVLSAGGNVGIGITNPSSELEVIGDVEIPAANDYTYSTAKTHYQSFAPTTFNSLLPDVYDFGTQSAATFYTYFRNGGTSFGYATVEVNLPDGARVGELEAWIYDNLATNPVRVSLYRQALGSPTASVMAEIESTTANASTTVQNLTDITIFNAVIDNQNYAYFLFFTGRQNSTESRLYGTKITYTVLEVD